MRDTRVAQNSKKLNNPELRANQHEQAAIKFYGLYCGMQFMQVPCEAERLRTETRWWVVENGKVGVDTRGDTGIGEKPQRIK